MAAAPRERPDVRVLTEITIIAQLAQAKLDRRLPAGLTSSQFGVLTHFMRRGGRASPAELASAFQVTRGAMTNTLQKLEAQGFVAIVGDAVDGRRKHVSLTPAGAAAYDAGVLAMKSDLEAMRSAFTDQEFLAALPFLEAFRDWFDENR